MLSNMLDILIVFALIILAIYLIKKQLENPPGPYGLPIFGYYPFLGRDPIKTIYDLSQKYGDLMSINLLGDTYWILNSYEAVKEAFVTNGDIFAARAANEYGLFQILGKGTVVVNEGNEWRAETKFLLSHLAQLGMGKSQFELTMHSILDDADKYIVSMNGEAHDYSLILRNYSFNVMSEMMFNKRYEVDSPTFLGVNNLIQKAISTLEYMNMIVSGNVFRLLIYNTDYQKTLEDAKKGLSDFSADFIERRLKTFDENNCNDMLDYLIKESLGPNAKYFTREDLPHKVAGMFLASDTPASMLYHMLFVIAAHPNIQQKVFDEIDNSIGADRIFGYLEKDRLPYTQAVIAEVMRFVSIAPFGNVHVNRVPTELMGYKAPIRQKVIANLFALSRDPKYFPNPNEFDPNNFLDENGYFKPNQASNPFGIGVRKCLGMKLAEVEVFIAFVRLMQKFEWELHENNDFNSRNVNLGNFQLLQSYKVCANKRE